VWLIVASSAPILSLVGRTDWLSVAVCASISIVIAIGVAGTSVPGWVNFIKVAAAVLYLGNIAGESVTCWQDQGEPWILAATLLIVSALAVRNGAQQTCRIGVSLAWVLLPGVLLILLSGMSDLQLPSFHTEQSGERWGLLPVFLLPLLVERNSAASKWSAVKVISISGLLAVLLSLLLGGTTPQGAVNTFYEYSKGVNLFGVAKRLESVAACMLTIGWFALFSYILAAICGIMEERGIRSRVLVWTATALAALILYNLTIPSVVTALLCLLSWGLIPLGTQALGGVRKSKKSDKTA